MNVTIKQNILTNNDCYKKGATIRPIGMQLHTIGTAQNSSSALASYWNQSGVEACVHYCVDAETEGLVLQFLPDNRRSWGDGGFGNGNLITVELMESDYMKYTGGANYTVSNEAKFKADVTRAYKTAVTFFALKCKEYGWDPTAKLSNGLYVVSSHDEGRRAGLSTAHVDPTHIWDRYGWSMDQFRKDVKAAMDGTSPSTTKYYRIRKTWEDEKSQKGAYTSLSNAKKNCPFGYAVFDERGNKVFAPVVNIHTLTAEQLNGLNESEKIRIVAPIYQQCQKDTGMLASVGLAQFCLESGYGTTDLAQNANNMHGMKCSLSGNSWANSTWDGKSKYTKKTQEQDINGNAYYITADFRKYPCIKDSVYDRAAYFIGAKNGSSLRYPGINKITDAVKQIEAIKKGGYATDVAYISKLESIVKKWNLTQYDTPVAPVTVLQEGSTGDAVKALQKNLNTLLNAKLKVDGDFGLATQKAVILLQTRYHLNADGCVGSLTASKIDSLLKGEKYSIKVVKESVQVYKGVSKACVVGAAPRGTYTIVKTYKGFGKLLSGAGWINLAEVAIV